jgi:hypothetical protein
MLKKGVTLVKFTRPASAMRVCLMAVENDQRSKNEIVEYTKLSRGKVDSALRNLAYIGAIVRMEDAQGRSVYQLPGRLGRVAPCLMGVRSIFDVSTAVDTKALVNTRKD